MITEAEKYELEKTRLRYFDMTENDLDERRPEYFRADVAPLNTCEQKLLVRTGNQALTCGSPVWQC